jgi:hypothetical protein
MASGPCVSTQSYRDLGPVSRKHVVEPVHKQRPLFRLHRSLTATRAWQKWPKVVPSQTVRCPSGADVFRIHSAGGYL